MGESDKTPRRSAKKARCAIYTRKSSEEGKDYSGAIAVFKDGAQLDDPDSIVSLADLIQRGYVRVGNPEAARFALLSRAAQLGHQGAQRAVEEQKLGDSAETAGTRFPT